FTYDACEKIIQTGGTGYSDGAGGADFFYKNACDKIRHVGVEPLGTIDDYKTDGSGHTNVTKVSTTAVVF
ncbi:MAG: hypothetical protein ACREJC_03015, partial [Tepidisphaeraceae bacterium]